MDRHGMDGAMGGWGIFGLLGSLFSLFLMVSLVALIAFVALRVFSGRQGLGKADPAEDILRERFARGEISAEELTQSLNTLRENAPPQSPRRGYEDYVREAAERLRGRREPES